MVQGELRKEVRLGKHVIHHGPGYELAVFVVDHLFPHDLPDALRQPAVKLSCHQQGIDHVAAIIYRDVLFNFHFTGFGVDFNRGDMRADGESEIRGLEEMRGFKSGLESRRNVARGVGGHDELTVGDALLRRFGRELSPAEYDVVRLGSEQMGRKRGHFCLELLRCHVSRGPAHGRSPASKRPDAVENSQRVTMDDVYVVGINAKLIGDQLRKRRLFTLAVRRRTRKYSDFSGRLDSHRSTFPSACRSGGRWADSTNLDVS